MTNLPLALYQSVLDHAPYGVALVNVEGAILLSNPRLAALLRGDGAGAARDNAAPTLAGSIRDLLPRAPEPGWDGLAADQTLDWETVLENASGYGREVRIFVGPLVENRARLVTVTDLTQQKERERRLYALWEFSSVVSASLDLDLLLESVSTEVCDVLEARRIEFVLAEPGTDKVEVRALYVADAEAPRIEMFRASAAAPLPAHIRQVLTQAETIFIDFQEDPTLGRDMCSITLPMIARGCVIGAFTAEGCVLERHLASEHISLCHAIANQTAVAVDNVRLLNAEIETRREIHRLQEYYRGILDNSPDGVFVTDDDGVVRFWNRRMEEMFDVAASDILETCLFDDAGWQAHSAAFQRAVERKEAVRIDRQAREKHTGEAVVESIHFQPLRSGDALAGILGRVSDVTDQARLEKQLIKSERMAAVGELAAGVAHNFNNVLASIGGDAQLLRMIAEEDHLGETVINSADMIYRETMRGGRIAHDLLSFARGQEPCLSEVDASVEVNAAIRLAKTYQGSGKVDLRSHIPQELPRVQADPNQMHQVFFNIILNAIQAMPNGGSVTVDARVVSGADGRARMEIMFEDTGVGIPPEHLHRIFDPFFTKRRGGAMGTGLGLSVSLSMIRGMDGDIRVDSEVGRGTVMTVVLPIVERRRRPRHGERLKTRILLADDEPNIRRTLSTFLTRRGYHVVAARDGSEAIGILEDGESNFHMAVLDLLMPKMSGLETVHRLRQMRPEMPVVLLTGVANTEELAQVAELGIAGHLKKPVDFDELLRTVEALAGPAEIPVLTR